jgi:predicted nucleic acid-binding protein
LLESGIVGTCAVVELEVGFSARSPGEYNEVMRDRVAGYEMLPMDDWVWQRALDVQARLAAAGQLRSVPIQDLLIAATAERHRVTLLHYDEDYERIAAVTGQATEWVVPRDSVS